MYDGGRASAIAAGVSATAAASTVASRRQRGLAVVGAVRPM
jgi:hypothetical protein